MEQLSSAASPVESSVQQDGKVVTSRGPGTAMEYAVALVELLYGKVKADEVSGPLVFYSPWIFHISCISIYVLVEAITIKFSREDYWLCE